MTEKNTTTHQKPLRGTVVSDAMDKTIVVKVERQKKHRKYGKYFRYFKKFKVHDEENKHKVGEVVDFIECRPLSKEKRWKVIH